MMSALKTFASSLTEKVVLLSAKAVAGLVAAPLFALGTFYFGAINGFINKDSVSSFVSENITLICLTYVTAAVALIALFVLYIRLKHFYYPEDGIYIYSLGRCATLSRQCEAVVGAYVVRKGELRTFLAYNLRNNLLSSRTKSRSLKHWITRDNRIIVKYHAEITPPKDSGIERHDYIGIYEVEPNGGKPFIPGAVNAMRGSFRTIGKSEFQYDGAAYTEKLPYRKISDEELKELVEKHKLEMERHLDKP